MQRSYTFTTRGEESENNCASAESLSASSINNNSATIQWSSDSEPISWTLEYGKDGFILGEGNELNSYTNDYIINGLDADTDYQLYIKSNCGSIEGAWIDTNFSTPNYAETTYPVSYNFNALDITTTSANIQWESDIDPVSWTFEYMPTSLLNGLAESSKTTTSYLKNYSLANLEPGTEYTIRIQANCGSGNLGAVRSYTFHTSSDPIQLPFNEYFDNAMRPQLPIGWKGMGNVGTNYSYDVTYPYRVRLVDSHYYTEESILISPEFEKALSSVRLSFDALITYSNKNQIIHIGTMSDPADESSFTAVFTFDLFEILESHNHKRIVTYLNNFTTDKHIAIKLENNSTAYFNYLFY